MAKWARCLTTREDFMHIHKASSVACILTSFAMTINGLACLFNHDLDPTNPVMDPVVKVWSLATIVGAIGAIPLSYSTRTAAHDIAIRFGFNILALAQITTVDVFVWTFPWWDKSFDWALDLMMVDSFFAGLWVTLEAALRNDELILRVLDKVSVRTKYLKEGIPNFDRLKNIITLVPAIVGMSAGSLGLLFKFGLGYDGLTELVQQCPGFMVNAAFSSGFLVLSLWE